MTEPTIVCRWCQGKGSRKLSPPLRRVFQTIVKLGQPTCPEIYQEIKSVYKSQTAANLNVKRLVNLKLVKKLPLNGSHVPRYEAV